MAGYDLDRYKDLEGVKGIQRVLERPHVVMEPIHREAPEPEEKEKPPKANVQLAMSVIAAGPPAEPKEKKKTGPANVERQMVIMSPLPAKAKKPATMSDIKL